MPVRFPSIGPARALYLIVVSVSLCVVSYRTFAASNNTPSADPAGSFPPVITAPGTTDSTAPAGITSTSLPTVTTSSPGTKPSSRPSGLPGSAQTTVTPQASPVTAPTTTLHLAPATTRAPAPTTTSTTLYPPNAIVMIIPFGTYARIQQGDDVEDVMPSVLNAKVGQTLYLVNKDEYAHLYGNVAVNPYRTTVYPFTYPGDQVGFCTIGPSRVITFRVTS